MLNWAHNVNCTMRSYCIVVTQAKHFSEFGMYLNARCPITRATFIKLLNLAYTVCKLAKSIFFVQLITDRLQNKEKFELQLYIHCMVQSPFQQYRYHQLYYYYTVCTNYVHCTFLGISFTHISVNFYIRVVIKIWSIYKKENNLTAQKKNMKSYKVSVAILII